MRLVVDLGCFPTGRHYPGIAHLLRVAALGLAEGFAGDHQVADLPIVAIDTETTGRDPASDRVVEVACVRWESGRITLQKSWLVNPGRPIPQEAFEVHGISDDETMRMLGVSSKLNADWGALTDLRDRGREKAEEWLEANYDQIGTRSTVDIRERYL